MKSQGHSDETICVKPPAIDFSGFASLATPTYRASTIVFPDAPSYRNRSARAPDGYTYGLAGTPTSRTLEAQLAQLHLAEGAIIVPSGQAAITIAFLTILGSGDHLLIADNVYPPVKHFVLTVMAKLGVETEFYDPTQMTDLRRRIRPGKTRLVWVESPGSTTMEVSDLRAISEISKGAGALVGCDNTWATGLLCKPLELGVDIVAEALTKYVGGHSDILLGALIVRDAGIHKTLRRAIGAMGICVSPDDCSLALRGLQTMPLRMRHVGEASEHFAQRLSVEFSVDVIHPYMESCPGHQFWKRDFKGSSGVFSVRLKTSQARVVDQALAEIRTFAIGASWGGTRSLLAPMDVNADRHIRREEAGAEFIRISIGLEGFDDLWQDLRSVFDVIVNSGRNSRRMSSC